MSRVDRPSPLPAKNRKEANAALRQAFAKLRGPPLQQMRAVRAGPDLRAAKRRLKRYLVARIRRPAIAHSRPTAHRDPSSSAPRPREGGARMVAASGRHGTGRDDGGGGDGDGDGNGGGGEPAQRLITAAPCDRDREPLAGGAS